MNSMDIYKNIKYLKILNEINVDIKFVEKDTRAIKKNSIYVGIKGNNFDGNDLFEEAFSNGADICILERISETEELLKYLKKNNKSIILVQDSILSLGELATYRRTLFKKPVIAITGSAGKTSTKDMTYNILANKYNVHKTLENFNNHIGLPLTILSLEDKNDLLVVEMGMNHYNELDYLTKIAKPNIALITNIGTAHIGNFGSRKNILKAKLEILNGLDSNGSVVINIDDDLLNKWYLKNKDKYNIITFAIDNEADYKASNIILEEDSSTFTCNGINYSLPIGGKQFIYNALGAIAISHLFDLSDDDRKKGISEFKSTVNRMNLIKKKNITIIDDCYNANFDAMCYSLKYLSKKNGRKIACIGSMLDLGDLSEDLHTKLGDEIMNNNIDILLTVGDYTNLINKRAIELGFNKDNSYHFNTNEDAIKKLKEIHTNEDIVLIKASHPLEFYQITDALVKEYK